MFNRGLLLVVAAVCTFSAHADGAQARVPFTAGLPDFPPLRGSVKSEPWTATLPATMPTPASGQRLHSWSSSSVVARVACLFQPA